MKSSFKMCEHTESSKMILCKKTLRHRDLFLPSFFQFYLFRHMLRFEAYHFVIKLSCEAKFCRIAIEWLQIYLIKEKIPDFAPGKNDPSRKRMLVQSSGNIFFSTTSHRLMQHWNWIRLLLRGLQPLNIIPIMHKKEMAEVKQSQTTHSFKYYFNKNKTPVPKYYYSKNRKAQILHTRLPHIGLCSIEIQSDYYCGVFNH